MKKMTNSLVLSSVLAASSLVSGAAMAGSLSGNVGVMSDYIFRGIDQATSATASGGVDYDLGNGLSVGAWGADVGDGLEVDVYGSYSGEVKDFGYSVGITTYNYTGDTFDGNYKEINLGVSKGPISASYNKGTHEDAAGADEDFTFISLSFELGNASATYGKWDSSEDVSALDGSYIELGYGLESGGFDIGVALIRSDKDLSGIVDGDGDDAADMSLTLTMGKSFDL